MEIQAGNLAQSALQARRALAFSAVVSEPPVDMPLDGVPYRMEIIVGPGTSANTKRVRARVTWRWKERDFRTFRETIICKVPR